MLNLVFCDCFFELAYFQIHPHRHYYQIIYTTFLSILQLLEIGADVHIGVQLLVIVSALSPPEYMSVNEIASWYTNSVFPQMLSHHAPLQSCSKAPSSTPLRNSCSRGCEVLSHCGFDLCFSDACSVAEHFFMYLLFICISLEKYLHDFFSFELSSYILTL